MAHSQPSLKSTFVSGLRWNIAGSLVFEFAKIAHQCALLVVVGPRNYGLIGIIYSIMYLAVHLTDLEAGPSLLPFLTSIFANRQNARRVLSWYVPLLIGLLSLGSIAGAVFYHRTFFSPNLAMPILLAIGVITEGVRIFARFVLHGLGVHRYTVVIDLAATLAFYAFVWIPYLVLGERVFITWIIAKYILMSATAAALLMGRLVSIVRHLPKTSTTDLPPNLFRRLGRVRILSYATHVSRNLFTGNFLTPFFGLLFGTDTAGLIKFASYLADAIKAFLRVSIGFSGSALLAKLKTRSLTLKRQAFAVLCRTFALVLYPLIGIVLLNFDVLTRMWRSYRTHWILASESKPLLLTEPAIVLALVFLALAVLERISLVYEEFYLVEEKVGHLLIRAIFEITLFCMVLLNSRHSPIMVLLLATLVRLISFAAIALHAHSRWKLVPRFAVSRPTAIRLGMIVGIVTVVMHSW